MKLNHKTLPRLGLALIATAGPIGTMAIAIPAVAKPSAVSAQAPGFYRFRVGDFTVTALSDGTFAFPASDLLNGVARAEIEEAYRRDFLSVPAEVSVNAYLIDTGSQLILVETGAGTQYGPTLGKLPENIRAAGYDPAAIDIILLTHSHADHFGGLTINGQRIFPNAIVRADRRDLEFWRNSSNMAKVGEPLRGNFPAAQAVYPAYDARIRRFDGTTQIAQGIRAVPAYGHTPGHIFYEISSQGRTLLLMGDILHAPPVQFPHPEITIRFDTDEPAARAARLKAFEDAAANRTLIGTTHLPFPGIGDIRKDGSGFAFVPENYSANR